ncbi:MAG: segregation/condensation protein A [Patescibacteria group bacterium]|nr:segregation/condensation protein A [Patescibacteria group bacterium]
MAVEENYKVELEVFQGPLDLLLHLIEKRKLHICDVSLLRITDDYIEYLNRAEQFSIKNSVDFVLTASILMLIKSKSLLPTLDLTLEEEQSIDDLEKRLKEYQEIKRLSGYVKERFGKRVSFFRQPEKNVKPIFSPDKNITISFLNSLINSILNNLPKKIVTPKVIVEKVISLEKMIENLTDRVKESLSTSFKKFSGLQNEGFTKKDKINVVVSFLAMLELVKQGSIAVKQSCQFGDIEMENQNVDVPDYK